MECRLTKTVGCTRALGVKIKGMEKDTKFFRTEGLTRANILITILMERESILGEMERSTKGNGNMERRKDTVFGRALKEISTSVSGKKTKSQAMESMFGSMETSMKVNGSTVSKRDKEQTCLLTVISTQELTLEACLMVSALTNGSQELHLKAVLLTA